MSKTSDKAKDVQPLWRRIGKGFIAAGVTAAYVTGIALAAPITLGITAGLGALRGLATRDSKKQGLLSAIGKGAVQGMLAPFGASATLAVDAVKGTKTNFNDLLLDSGKKMPDIPGFGRNSSDQPLWKRVGKVIAGAAMIGGTIAACAVAGPAVATFVAVAGATGAYKGYKEAKKEGKSGIWGAVKGAVNRVISPVASGALLIAHGVQGCETKSLAVNMFEGVAGQFAPLMPKQAANVAPEPPQREAAPTEPHAPEREAVKPQPFHQVAENTPEVKKPPLPPKPPHLKGQDIRRNLAKPTATPASTSVHSAKAQQHRERRKSTGGHSGLTF